MNFIKRALCAALIGGSLVLGGGCEPVGQIKQENRELQEIILKQEQENKRLMAQLQALKAKPDGVDPAELSRLEIEINKRDKQLELLRRSLYQMQGRVALSERVEAKLQQLADELGGELVGNKLMLPCDYFFASGRYDLMPEGKQKLQKFAQVMRGENLMLMVVGHTDNDPIVHSKTRGVQSNLQLSLLRSIAVLDELNKSGYPRQLIYPTGWGELRPVVPNDSRANKQLNRRVEIYVDPAGSGLMDASAITNVAPVPDGGSFQPSGNVQIIDGGGPVTMEY